MGTMTATRVLMSTAAIHTRYWVLESATRLGQATQGDITSQGDEEYFLGSSSHMLFKTYS